MNYEDQQLLSDVAEEVRDRAMELAGKMTPSLNRYSAVTARADCLRLLRAAIELSPTLPPK